MEEANSSNHIINWKSSHFRSIVVSSSLSQWHDPECAHVCRGYRGFSLSFVCLKDFQENRRGSWSSDVKTGSMYKT